MVGEVILSSLGSCSVKKLYIPDSTFPYLCDHPNNIKKVFSSEATTATSRLLTQKHLPIPKRASTNIHIEEVSYPKDPLVSS